MSNVLDLYLIIFSVSVVIAIVVLVCLGVPVLCNVTR